MLPGSNRIADVMPADLSTSPMLAASSPAPAPGRSLEQMLMEVLESDPAEMAEFQALPFGSPQKSLPCPRQHRRIMPMLLPMPLFQSPSPLPRLPQHRRAMPMQMAVPVLQSPSLLPRLPQHRRAMPMPTRTAAAAAAAAAPTMPLSGSSLATRVRGSKSTS